MIRIGLLSTLIGPYQRMGEEGVRGAELALEEFGHQVAGQPVELVVRATNAIASSATDAAVDLLLNEGCDLIVGPLAGDEGEAIRDFAREHPGNSFINGTSASQALFNPASNFYAFSGSGAQWMAGFGRYCYETEGHRKIVTIGQGYSYPFAQVGGFSLEFCRSGGEISAMVWSGLGTEDFGPLVDQIPDDVDAVLSVLAGPDFVSFVHAYHERGRETPIMVGQASGDIISLHALRDYADWLVGMLAVGPVVYDNPAPEWAGYVERYRQMFPNGYYAPSLYCTCYYVAVKAGLLALDAVDADLSDDQYHFQQALANLSFETPTGPVQLDHNHLAIVDNFVGQIDLTQDGALVSRWVETVPQVNCTLGLPEHEYLRIGNFNANNMPCQPKQDESPDSFLGRLQQHQQRKPRDS